MCNFRIYLQLFIHLISQHPNKKLNLVFTAYMTKFLILGLQYNLHYNLVMQM